MTKNEIKQKQNYRLSYNGIIKQLQNSYDLHIQEIEEKRISPESWNLFCQKIK